jgi:hypothetical protein
LDVRWNPRVIILPCSGVEIILPSSSNLDPSTSAPCQPPNSLIKEETHRRVIVVLSISTGALLFEELMTSSFSSHLFSLLFALPTTTSLTTTTDYTREDVGWLFLLLFISFGGNNVFLYAFK